MTQYAYKGNGSTVTLDSDAGTLTFVHSGVLNSRARKKASPRTIALGDIESIDWHDAKFTAPAEFRVVLTDRDGYDNAKLLDLNYVAGTASIGDFARAVQAASTGLGAADAAAPDTSHSLVSAGPEATGWFNSLAERMPLGMFEGITLRRDSIHFRGTAYPIAGAKATVDIGGTQRRTTATRVVLGSFITPGVGTAIGAMAKKKSSNIYVTVELADGQILVVEAKAKMEGKARKFAGAVNQASALESKKDAAAVEPTTSQFVKSVRIEAIEPTPIAPIPSPGVPAGWYPDPSGGPSQRYWDGNAWTESTAPLAPNE